MNEQDLNAFEAWFDPDDNENYLDCWQACCEYKDKQYQTLYDNARVTIQQEQDRCREQLAAKDAMIAKLRGIVLKMLDCWWPFVHGSVMPSDTAKRLRQEASDAIQPNDDSTLQEYVEKRLDESPEMALLNQIGDLLEPIEYQGSYVDGIQALVKQAKREGQAEMRERAADRVEFFTGEYTYRLAGEVIRALPIAGETSGIEGENE